MRASAELEIARAPRPAYARLTAPPATYLFHYLILASLIIGAAAAISATGALTLELLVSLSLTWMFFPLAHVLIALAVTGGAAGRRTSRARAAAWLLQGHVPWSIWLLVSALMLALGGYAAYRPVLWLAIVPFVLTARILYAFGREVLALDARQAAWRVVAHQTLTWLAAAVYIDKAVGLMPRLMAWLR